MTQERLKELFVYDPETGHFFHRFKRWRKCIMNTPVGTLKDGYLVARIEWKVHRLHRLAWLWMHGEYPSGDIDHINGNRADNRAVNLRAATRTQNNFNRGPSLSNPSGIKGVCWHPLSKKWMARSRMNGVTTYLGVFPTKEEAGAAVQRFNQINHGEFYKPHTPTP